MSSGGSVDCERRRPSEIGRGIFVRWAGEEWGGAMRIGPYSPSLDFDSIGGSASTYVGLLVLPASLVD